MNRTWIVSISVGALILIALFAWQLSPHSAVAPTTTASVSQSPELEMQKPPELGVQAVVTSRNHPVQTSVALAAGDSVVSWDFKGAYTGNPELVIKAQDEISRLSGLLVGATSSDMILSVGIANQYELLGDGKHEYEYLVRAITEGGTVDGLPWHNLGVLMERLGALETARVAYEKATLVQPQFKQWHFAYLEFLTARMKDDVSDIEKAFAAAFKNLGQDADILSLQTEWKKS